MATLTVQASNFILLAVAARLLDTEEFARLSSMVAVVMISSALFEFGLNVTATKVFGESGDLAVFNVAAKIRIWTLLVVALTSILFLKSSFRDVSLAITLGACTNIWNGMRAADQALQRFRKFVRNSFLFAAFRIIVTLPLLFLLGDAVSAAIGLYLAPMILLMLFSSGWREIRASSYGRIGIKEILSYAKFVYLNSLAFVALPYFPQLYIDEHLSSEAAAGYGLIVAFSGPVGLLIYSLRSTLLPKFFGSGSLENDVWSARGFLVLLLGWFMLLGLAFLLAEGLEYLFGVRFEGIRDAFLVYFGGVSLTGFLGIYGLSVHTLGVPQISLYVNLLRVFALFFGLIAFGESLMSVVLVVSTVMTLGEVALLFLVYRCRQRGRF